MAPRKFVVGGNWKCNGSKESIKALAQQLNAGPPVDASKVEVVCAPPAVYATYARSLLRGDYAVALQDCWVGPAGAYTGEVAAEMIADCFPEAPWVVLGHSERRHLPELAESDDTVARKTKYALDCGVRVMLCIGETLEERDAGRTREVNERQLNAVKARLDTADWDRVVVAYEPVWAIGTGKVATPEQAQEAHAEVRAWIAKQIGDGVADATRIIYGGSVKGANAGELARQHDIDGFLVGGASLKGDEFLKIVSAGQ